MNIGLGIGIPFTRSSLWASIFTPSALFLDGSTQGVWYDPSDNTTLFQDAAGTMSVTAVEQPVGLMKDKSGGGNHAFNPSGNSANFPVLSARVNLLTKTEQFDDAVWAKANSSVSANVGVAPDGTSTADKLIDTAANVVHSTYQQVTVTTNTRYTLSFYAKAAGRNWVTLDPVYPTVANNITYFDLQNGVVGTNDPDNTASITNVGNGWYFCTVSHTTGASQTLLNFQIAPASANNLISYTGNGVDGVLIWGAQLVVTNDALNQPTYQRVNTASDYDTVGFKPYLKFNGTNQWLQTNSIDFTYGDKMFVSAGVRKLSDAARAAVVELGNNVFQSFILEAPQTGGSTQYVFRSSGSSSSLANYVDSSVAAPTTNVLSCASSISEDKAILRVNGSQAVSSTINQGTGNYGNYPLYIGARAGTSLWFNGRLYGMVIVGKQASSNEIQDTEKYLNNKTAAYN